MTKTLLVAGVLCSLSMPLAAKNHHKSYNKHNSRNHVSYDYAKVMNVNPVYETYKVNHPVEHCYDERVPVSNKTAKRNGSYTNEIIGGVIGAAVGNRVGKRGGGSARDVATVVGAVLGASVANDIEKRGSRNRSNQRSEHYSHNNTAYKTVQYCELQDSYTTKREVVGYDVAYRYNGQVYHTNLERHPGQKIRVQVAVKPA